MGPGTACFTDPLFLCHPLPLACREKLTERTESMCTRKTKQSFMSHSSLVLKVTPFPPSGLEPVWAVAYVAYIPGASLRGINTRQTSKDKESWQNTNSKGHQIWHPDPKRWGWGVPRIWALSEVLGYSVGPVIKIKGLEKKQKVSLTGVGVKKSHDHWPSDSTKVLPSPIILQLLWISFVPLKDQG